MSGKGGGTALTAEEALEKLRVGAPSLSRLTERARSWAVGHRGTRPRCAAATDVGKPQCKSLATRTRRGLNRGVVGRVFLVELEKRRLLGTLVVRWAISMTRTRTVDFARCENTL
jgi:hypothetical protein